MDCIVPSVTRSRTRLSDVRLAVYQARMKGCRPVSVVSGLQRLEAVTRALISWGWAPGTVHGDAFCHYANNSHWALLVAQWLKNPPVNQCRRHWFGPWSGKIPHAKEQLNLWAATTEPTLLQLVKPEHPRARALQQEKSLQREACALHLKSSPHSP